MAPIDVNNSNTIPSFLQIVGTWVLRDRPVAACDICSQPIGDKEHGESSHRNDLLEDTRSLQCMRDLCSSEEWTQNQWSSTEVTKWTQDSD